jgi:hypothetical protein
MAIKAGIIALHRGAAGALEVRLKSYASEERCSLSVRKGLVSQVRLGLPTALTH